MNKTQFELDALSGDVAVLKESFEALLIQTGWTTDKFSECFNRDGSLDHDKMIGYSYGLKTEMTNIFNLISHFSNKLNDMDSELQKIIKADDGE